MELECLSKTHLVHPGRLGCKEAREKNQLPRVPLEEHYENYEILEKILANPTILFPVCQTCPVFAKAYPEVITALSAPQSPTR